MHIHDLPLPLRLRNALVRAGFSTDIDIKTYLATDSDLPIEGVGATGMRQLEEWAAGVNHASHETASEPTTKPTGGPEVIRRRKPTAEKPINGHDLDAKPRETDEDASIYRRDSVVTPGRWGQLADTSMRGGLEAMRDLKVNHQWDASVVQDPYWTLARPADAPAYTMDAELSARVASMRAEAARLHAETRVETSKDTLTLRLEPELQTQIGLMIPLIKGLTHVKELGVEVSRETVARMALIRGLDALERQYAPKNDAKKADPTPDPAAEAPVSASEPRNGVHPTPDGWTKCGPSDKIPAAQAVIHDYYTQNNWFRYWGKAGDSVIHFYWSPEVQFQDLDVFPGTDKNGKTVAVQDTPWGPGHIVPLNWSN